MRHTLLLTVMLLIGCSTFVEHNTTIPIPTSKPMQIEIHQLKGGNPNVLGTADITGDRCVIHLRKYPHCLAHEVRHCFEGNWHKGEDSDDWCY